MPVSNHSSDTSWRHIQSASTFNNSSKQCGNRYRVFKYSSGQLRYLFTYTYMFHHVQSFNKWLALRIQAPVVCFNNDNRSSPLSFRVPYRLMSSRGASSCHVVSCRGVCSRVVGSRVVSCRKFIYVCQKRKTDFIVFPRPPWAGRRSMSIMRKNKYNGNQYRRSLARFDMAYSGHRTLKDITRMLLGFVGFSRPWYALRKNSGFSVLIVGYTRFCILSNVDFQMLDWSSL